MRLDSTGSVSHYHCARGLVNYSMRKGKEVNIKTRTAPSLSHGFTFSADRIYTNHMYNVCVTLSQQEAKRAMRGKDVNQMCRGGYNRARFGK